MFSRLDPEVDEGRVQLGDDGREEVPACPVIMNVVEVECLECLFIRTVPTCTQEEMKPILTGGIIEVKEKKAVKVVE